MNRKDAIVASALFASSAAADNPPWVLDHANEEFKIVEYRRGGFGELTPLIKCYFKRYGVSAERAWCLSTLDWSDHVCAAIFKTWGPPGELGGKDECYHIRAEIAKRSSP